MKRNWKELEVSAALKQTRKPISLFVGHFWGSMFVWGRAIRGMID